MLAEHSDKKAGVNPEPFAANGSLVACQRPSRRSEPATLLRYVVPAIKPRHRLPAAFLKGCGKGRLGYSI